MKRYTTVLLLTVLLSGCSIVDSVLPPTYDNNEYLLFARLDTHSQFMQTECADPAKVRARLDLMMYDADLLVTYSSHLPRTSDINEISKVLAEDVREMKQRYDSDTPSPAYCNLKSKTFAAKTTRALQSVGKLQRS